MRGRYSHVAAVMEGRVLLVAGGYSGVARGDLVAYKVPLFVSSDFGDRVSRSETMTSLSTQEVDVIVGKACSANQERRLGVEENGHETIKDVCVSPRMQFARKHRTRACV